MKKKFVRVMLFGALTLTVSTVVTSCKDYDDDIKGLQEQVDKITSTSPVSTEDMKSAVEKAKQDLQTQLNDLSALVENPDGEKTFKINSPLCKRFSKVRMESVAWKRRLQNLKMPKPYYLN